MAKAIKIAEKLEENNINSEVINARFLKPIDSEKIKESILKTKFVVTIEDGTRINGLDTAVDEIILNSKLEKIKRLNYAYPDTFIKHGTIDELEKIYGLDAESITNRIIKEKQDKIDIK